MDIWMIKFQLLKVDIIPAVTFPIIFSAFLQNFAFFFKTIFPKWLCQAFAGNSDGFFLKIVPFKISATFFEIMIFFLDYQKPNTSCTRRQILLQRALQHLLFNLHFTGTTEYVYCPFNIGARQIWHRLTFSKPIPRKCKFWTGSVLPGSKNADLSIFVRSSSFRFH